MKITLTPTQLSDESARHARAISEFGPSGLFTNEAEAIRFVDLVADRQRGEVLVPSLLKWIEKVEAMLAQQQDYAQVQQAAIAEQDALTTLRANLANDQDRVKLAEQQLAELRESVDGISARAYAQVGEPGVTRDALANVHGEMLAMREAARFVESEALPRLEKAVAASRSALSRFLKKAQGTAA